MCYSSAYRLHKCIEANVFNSGKKKIQNNIAAETIEVKHRTSIVPFGNLWKFNVNISFEDKKQQLCTAGL